jgi:GT2 family glycosyltransferase
MTVGAESGLTLALGIATAGRKEVLGETLRELGHQTRMPDRLIVCPADERDLDPAAWAGLAVAPDIVLGPRGSCAQRNAILAACDAVDLLVFLDDDFFPAPDFLAATEALFRDHPDVALATGVVLADGTKGPGLGFDEARAHLAGTSARADAIEPIDHAWGCNMAIRMAPVRRHGIRFDEDLPLYGWCEDYDFSRRVAPHGRIVLCHGLQGVHLGTKSGRTSGVRLGYSQVANPLHLMRKGTMSARFALRLIVKPFLANIVRSWRPEPETDRAGRLRGNLMAMGDLLRGTLTPRRIIELD